MEKESLEYTGTKRGLGQKIVNRKSKLSKAESVISDVVKGSDSVGIDMIFFCKSN